MIDILAVMLKLNNRAKQVVLFLYIFNIICLLNKTLARGFCLPHLWSSMTTRLMPLQTFILGLYIHFAEENPIKLQKSRGNLTLAEGSIPFSLFLSGSFLLKSEPATRLNCQKDCYTLVGSFLQVSQSFPNAGMQNYK